MEKRHFEIRDRAGLEESRLNQDFVDFLKKWGTPVLLIVALVATGYSFYTRRQVSKAADLSEAFRALNAASGSFATDRVSWGTVDTDGKGVPQEANPETLIQIAQEHKGVVGISVLARLTAADGLLRTTRTGVKPGSEIGPDGNPVNPDDLLTAELRAANLDQSEQLYTEVLTQARGQSGSLITQMNAMYGLAAVAESRGKYDDAKAQYETIAKLVDGTPFSAHVNVAKGRIRDMDILSKLPAPFAKADLPRIPGFDPDPTPPPAPEPVLTPILAPVLSPTPGTGEGPPAGPVDPIVPAAVSPTAPAATPPASPASPASPPADGPK